MKTILIGFSRPIKWKPFAKAIMWVDKTNYDHAYIEFPSMSWGVSFIYQSSGTRTNFMSDTYFDSINTDVEVYEIDLPDDIYTKIGKMCVEREGRPYPVVEILGKAYVALVYIALGKKIKNPFPSVDTDCISEVAYLLTNGLGVEVPLDMNSITVRPFRDFVAGLPMVKLVPQSEAV